MFPLLRAGNLSSAANTAHLVVGIIGNIISVCLFLSPMPAFVEIMKRKSLEQHSPLPYLANLMNCLVWVLYGLPMVHPNNILVLTVNGAGCGFYILYLTLFCIYADRQKRLRVFLGFLLELTLIALLASYSLTMMDTHQRRSVVIGTIGTLFNIGMNVFQLSDMKLVISTKSVERMPFFFSVVSVGNRVAWTIYSFIPFDPFIGVTNWVGIGISVAQLILYAIYFKPSAARNNANVALDELEL